MFEAPTFVLIALMPVQCIGGVLAEDIVLLYCITSLFTRCNKLFQTQDSLWSGFGTYLS